jgi:hypothetical protein
LFTQEVPLFDVTYEGFMRSADVFYSITWWMGVRQGTEMVPMEEHTPKGYVQHPQEVLTIDNLIPQQLERPKMGGHEAA